jgi:adenosylcobinamide-GDP ribazoletransferase
LSGLGGAFRLLTRIPLGEHASTRGLGRVAGWFPVVGLVVGLTVGGVYAVLYPWMPSMLSAVIAVGGGIVLTGAIHEDGLADSMDSFGTGASGEKALQIMRDSRLGTYGTLALVLSVLWRVVALGSLGPAVAVAAAVVAHVIGRTSAIGLMVVAPAARAEGLGRLGVAEVDGRQGALAIAVGLGLTLSVVGWVVALGVIVAAVMVVFVIRWVSMRRIGGITGDVLGACEQLTEMGSFALVAGATWAGWLPWWLGVLTV